MAYTKNHDPWTALDAITTTSMNNFETIYTEVASYISTHDHDTVYYTKVYMNATYITFAGDGPGSGTDADLIYHASGNMHAADFGAATGDTTGIIIIWYGALGDVPSGWHICDGNADTINLQDVFVIGAGDSYPVGATGGSNTFTPTGTVSVSGHILTVSEMGPHRHPYMDRYGNSSGTAKGGTDLCGYALMSYSPPQYTVATGGGLEHDHNASMTGDAANIMPPYYSLYYIQKT